ncbi:MAG: helix-turn-helix domain-containing protein [Nocardioides sp.]
MGPLLGSRTQPRTGDVVSPVMHSVGGFARVLGVSEMTVYRAIHAGRLPAIRFGGRYVIPGRALDELVESAMASGGLVELPDAVGASGGVA